MKIPAPVNGSLLQPKFIPGELVIAEATNVLKFTSLSKTKGLSGSLFVTNARVVFVSSDHVCSEDSVPLLSINTLWYYESSSKATSASSSSSGKKTKRRVKLGPMKSHSSTSNTSNFYSNNSSSLSQQYSSHTHNLIPSSGSTRIHEIFIVCSNFRTLRISFKFSPIDQGLRICNAIIHHAFPEQLERLFYFDFCKAYTAQWTSALGSGGSGGSSGGSGSSGSVTSLNSRLTVTIPSYMDKGDWLRELNVTRTTPGGYRISGINEGFQICGSLPEWIVVPSDVNDAKVMNLAEKLKGCRPPHWTWGDSRGAAILVMGKLNNESDSSSENAFFESLRKVHPKGIAPTICDLDSVINLKEIRQSFLSLVDLCCPESFSQYQDVDSKFYSALDHTKWLLLVSRVLAKCRDIVDQLNQQGNAVIFQEQEGRDASCLFTSLVQLIVDPRFRTVTGFFSLIQKDWVAFGHPFHSTYMHTSPVFLLFLDSVFQLINQNPLEFEFNDKLLSSLWDSSFDCTTGTFLFDSPQQRKVYELCKDSTAWVSIFSNAGVDTSSTSSNSNSPSPTSTSAVSRTAIANNRRDLLLGKTVIPRALLNPFFPVKSLLSTSGSSSSPSRNIHLIGSQQHPDSGLSSNTHVLSSCSAVMCDIAFWENLYLHRTLETIPMIVTSGEGLVNSDPLIPQMSASPLDSASPSPSPSSKFYFPLPALQDTYHQRRRPGRDTVAELKIVDDLLDNLSATKRFQRNVSSSTSALLSGGGSSSHTSSSVQSRMNNSASAGLLQQRHGFSSVATHRARFNSPTPSANASPIISSTSRFVSNASSTSSSPRRNPFINLTST
ncbi:Myotubularin-related protein 10 [Orchesella cincta]|uniref:Myotubularin-related protein 10 n=1 Tax=Orchesella cincta TaxID=48709 RepID=A0A1D2NGP9_ORCCI|nr:Myotubularin-related protein 10 [Orchesella cincta]